MIAEVADVGRVSLLTLFGIATGLMLLKNWDDLPRVLAHDRRAIASSISLTGCAVILVTAGFRIATIQPFELGARYYGYAIGALLAAAGYGWLLIDSMIAQRKKPPKEES